MSVIETQQELIGILGALGDIEDSVRNGITCQLIGHSRIQSYCFGYFYCSRCGSQVGDSLGGLYQQAESVVVIGHDCPTCQENSKTLTWRDKIFTSDQFSEVDEDKK